MQNNADKIRALLAELARARPGSETYWSLKRRIADQQRIERTAMKEVDQHGIKHQTLACGCAWDQVFQAHNGSWVDALEFWRDARKWEYEHPNNAHHDHEPQAQNYAPGYGYQPDQSAGYYTHDGTGYYYVVGGQYYPVPDHLGHIGPPRGPDGSAYGHGQPPPTSPPAANKNTPPATPAKDERDEHLLNWTETQKAWQFWKESYGSEPNEPPKDDKRADDEDESA